MNYIRKRQRSASPENSHDRRPRNRDFHGGRHEDHGSRDSHSRHYQDHRRNYSDHRNPRRENRDSYRPRRDDRNFHDRNNRDNRRRRSASFDHANAKWGRDSNSKQNKKEPTEPKQKPNFGLSGKLTEETNTFKGVVIKYSEPPEARKPKRRWRLYPFKGDKALQTLYIHRESAYLIGRERKVVDLAVDHPSCSKQHAALQYRLVPFTREDGSAGRPFCVFKATFLRVVGAAICFELIIFFKRWRCKAKCQKSALNVVKFSLQ